MQIETSCSLSPATWWTWVWLTDCMAASSRCKAQWMRIPKWPHFCSMPQDSYVGCAHCALLSLEGKTPMLEHLSLACLCFSLLCGTHSAPPLSFLVIGFLHWDMDCIFWRWDTYFCQSLFFFWCHEHELDCLKTWIIHFLFCWDPEVPSASLAVSDKTFTKPNQAMSRKQLSLTLVLPPPPFRSCRLYFLYFSF